jgi:hypothetical protein
VLARFSKLLAVVSILFASSFAIAAPRDTAANKKIDEAIRRAPRKRSRKHSPRIRA